MSNLFDNFNKFFKKDLLPDLVKYLNDPKNKITDNLNDFLNDPQAILNNIIEKFPRNRDAEDNQGNYMDIENLNDINISFDDTYDELFKRLILIEENMIQLQKILKEKN